MGTARHGEPEGRAEGLQPGMIYGRQAGRVEGPQTPAALRQLLTSIALAS